MISIKNIFFSIIRSGLIGIVFLIGLFFAVVMSMVIMLLGVFLSSKTRTIWKKHWHNHQYYQSYFNRYSGTKHAAAHDVIEGEYTVTKNEYEDNIRLTRGYE